MTWKDKLEIGLKEDAPYRKDNLPESEVSGPEVPSGPGRSPEIPGRPSGRRQAAPGRARACRLDKAPSVVGAALVPHNPLRVCVICAICGCPRLRNPIQSA